MKRSDAIALDLARKLAPCPISGCNYGQTGHIMRLSLCRECMGTGVRLRVLARIRAAFALLLTEGRTPAPYVKEPNTEHLDFEIPLGSDHGDCTGLLLPPPPSAHVYRRRRKVNLS